MSGHPSRHGGDDDILGIPANWARVRLVSFLVLLCLTDKDCLQWAGKSVRSENEKLFRSRDSG